MSSKNVCYVCGSSDFDKRTVEYIYRRQGKYLIVRDVPCEVCLHCGERYYPGDSLLRIEERFREIYEQHALPADAIQVPIEAYVA